MIPVKHFTHFPVDSPILTIEEGNSRRYILPDGRKYPSVTTILGELPNPALVKWRKRKGEAKAKAITKAAAYRGELLHDIIKKYLRNQKLVFDSPFIQEMFKKVQPLLHKIDNIRIVEEPLYSDKLYMAGTPDVIGDWDGELSVIDFKTTHILKKESWIIRYYCQVGAYGVMYHELFKKKPKKGVVIIISDDDEYSEPQVFEKANEECIKMLDEYVSKLIEHRKFEQANNEAVVH